MTTDRDTKATPRTIKASEFKAKCLKLMDEVAETGVEIIITKNGQPVSKLAPFNKKRGLFFGRNRDMIQVHGDIVSPMPGEWFEKPSGDEEDLL